MIPKAFLKTMPMISCQKAAELMSEKMDKGLSLRKWLQLLIHLSVCEACHTVSRQFTQLRRALRFYYQDLLRGRSLESQLPDASRQRIVDYLKHQ